jgi:hypothetical protein
MTGSRNAAVVEAELESALTTLESDELSDLADADGYRHAALVVTALRYGSRGWSDSELTYCKYAVKTTA